MIENNKNMIYLKMARILINILRIKIEEDIKKIKS